MSDRLHFKVTGSAGVIYEVSAQRDVAGVRITCTCEAGNNKLACKHRTALLAGDGTALISGGDGLATLATWLPGTALDHAIRRVAEANATAETAKRNLSAARKALGRVMLGG